MNTIPTFDAIIVGGGPAGSTCASILLKSGLHTLLLDRANFPRVKLCAGWLSPPIWDILGISPKEYMHGLWEWNNVHIHFRGRKYTVKSNGYFIRRYEFDDFLLRRSNVQTIEGFNVRQIEKDVEGYWVIDNQYRAKYLIGAGGTHCPVARSLFPKPDNLQCGTQEREFEGDPEEIAASRAGKDGEPEILLHDDMKGYSWNVPKGRWLNIGTGTKVAREVVPAWNKARAFFEGNGTPGTIPLSSRPMLDKMKGHGYITFETNHLSFCQADNVFLVGDALGLAQPLTGEGILPSVLSGKLCGTAIAEGAPETYKERLRTHPVISDYRIQYAIQTGAKKIFKNKGGGHFRESGFRDKIIVKVFAMLFSGKRIPGGRIVAMMRK
jgi:flavin-dependent dehydrogenase